VTSASTVTGLVVALGAAGCYEVGYAYQAVQARRMPVAHALRPSLLGQLLRNARWLTATALSLLGWPLQVAALALAPLALVQPALALGLVLLLVLGRRVLHEPVGRREIIAVALVIAGIALVATSAPARTTSTATTGLAIAIAALAAVALLPYLLARRPARAMLAVVSAGAADSVAALAAKVVSGALADGRWSAALGLTVVAALAGLMATTSEMSALQRAPATRVGPIVLALQIAIPVAVAGAVGAEDWSATPLDGVVLAAGLAGVVAGAALLAASRAVLAITEAPARAPRRPRS
jgi:drug/metabolite transporter (DMT)-like permease